MNDCESLVIKQAMKSPMKKKYGAILMYRNKIISVGYNYDTHISTKKYTSDYLPNVYSIHAEQDCINKVKNKTLLKKSILILVCLGSGNKLKSCEPCCMCSHIIKKYKIRKVVSIYPI